jgi:hypothetical protein
VHRENDRRALGRQLKRITVPACHESRSATALLRRYRGGEEIIRLVPRRFRIRKPARRDKFRQSIELFDQCVVELTPALVCGKFLVAVSGRGQRIPTNEHATRTLCLVESQQKVRKADDGPSALATAPNDRLRDTVICAMRERVAVND